MKALTKYIAKQFGKPSGIGGAIVTYAMNRQNGKQYQAVLDNINVQPTDTILDIGFGNGYLIGNLLKNNPAKIYGIEISPYMLNKVSNKYKQALSTGKLDLRFADIKMLPFEDVCFDKICTVNTLYFWDDTDSSFSEIKRTLKPGGIFINVFYSKDFLDKMPHAQYGYSKYSVEQIIAMTEKSGLEVVQIIEIQPKDSFCVIAKKENVTKIRNATISDIPAMTELYKSTILSVNRKDYSAEEVEDWASCGDNMANLHKSFSEQYYIIAENDHAEIIGFASINDTGYMHTLFVHKDFQHQGIATLLYRTLEEYVKSKGVKKITSEVSITAKPFFEKLGFIVNEEQKRKANKLCLTNYKMSKKIET